MAEDLPLARRCVPTAALPRPKKGREGRPTTKEKGTKRLVMVDGQGRPAGNLLALVASAEVALAAGDRRGKRCSANGKLGDTQP